MSPPNTTRGGSSFSRPNPSKATAPNPSNNQGGAERRISIQTWFTQVGGTQEVYPGDRLWAKVTMTLETAGPVSVGQRARLLPVLGGGGVLLTTNEPQSFIISKGDSLYMAATSVNRVKVVVEALPWLEQLSGTLDRIGDLIMGALGLAKKGT